MSTLNELCDALLDMGGMTAVKVNKARGVLEAADMNVSALRQMPLYKLEDLGLSVGVVYSIKSVLEDKNTK